jgi:hypothetical protein
VQDQYFPLLHGQGYYRRGKALLLEVFLPRRRPVNGGSARQLSRP